jgi:4-hydroxy-tetrahydrodipicolinate reductase
LIKGRGTPVATRRRYRIVQWATGNTGQRALREVIRDPSLDLVGVRVYDPAKDGVDAGELCGEEPTGVLATTDRDAILKLEADCCTYMPRATGRGPTRAGLTEDELVDDVAALLGAGTNVVTTCSDMFARGVRLSDVNHARVVETCERSGASVWASGSDPGFATETLPMALLSVQRHVDLIEIEEFGDLSHRPSAHMVLEQMRFGKPLAEFDPDRRKKHLFGEYQPPLGVLADLAGFTIDEWVAEGGVAAAKEDLTIVAGTIAAGTAAAQRIVIHGRSEGVDRIRFTQYGFVAMDVEPDWGLQPTGWRIRIHGDAPFDVRMPFPVALDDLASYVPAFNANGPVNAIPYVCAAAPGFLTTEDLPHILPRGPRDPRGLRHS